MEGADSGRREKSSVTPAVLAHRTLPGRRSGNIKDDFSSFYRQHVKALVAFLINQGASVSDASDIAQMTMEKLYQRWADIEYHKAWAYKVASRELIRKFADVRESPVEEVPEPSSLLPDPASMSEWESRHYALRVLQVLPPRQRQIMAWTLSDFTPGEIAEQLSLSPEAVRASLKKARRTATALVRGWEEE
ncbi:sigma-70 family RNA polymerase sigma factor [Streptomyces sp. NBRC 110465]|uniref:sigma-70 family RNA polymerase sigma factor n=1 Tax=Streptomyces sp. NBRC 110465 TaxID=1897621 RepID=UPI0009A0AC1D|nr:sigma-70 family RNA polymerase sigma factor [Streptomyces sp. NBRC 110465]